VGLKQLEKSRGSRQVMEIGKAQGKKKIARRVKEMVRPPFKRARGSGRFAVKFPEGTGEAKFQSSQRLRDARGGCVAS